MKKCSEEQLRTFKRLGLQDIFAVMAISGITIFSMAGVLSCGEDDLTRGHIPVDVQGVVLDSLTLQPIDSVIITVLDTAETSMAQFTDSLGAFKFGIVGIQVPLFFRKIGYETKLLRANKNDTLVVLLAPQ